MNTEVAVLNKINAANLIGLRNTQDTKQIIGQSYGAADPRLQTCPRCGNTGH